MDDMTIKDLIRAGVDKIDLKKVVEEKVAKAVTEALEQCIASSFGYSSKFKKVLDEKITEMASVAIDRIKLPEYNTLLLNAAQASLNSDLSEQAEKFRRDIERLINGEFKREYKLSEFVAELKKCRVEDSEWHSSSREKKLDEITLLVDSVTSFSGSIHISFEKGKRQYACEIQLSRRIENGKTDIRTIEGIDPKKVLTLNGLSSVQLFLFKCYTRGLIITELDEANVKKEFDYSDYEVDYSLHDIVPSDIFEDGPDYTDSDDDY